MTKQSENVNIVHLIYNDLKSKILTGELQNNDRLVETRISKEYETSRIHVKDAFRLLEAESLVEHIPKRGFIVKGVSSNIIYEIAEIRQALEKVVVKDVILNASDEDIVEFEKIAKRFDVFVANGMFEDGMHELEIFYRKMYSLCNNKSIINILEQYSGYIYLIQRITTDNVQASTEGVDNLYSLISSIKERDYPEAIKQMERRHKNLLD